MTVGSAVFAIYTFEITKPRRDVVFRVYAQSFTVPDGLEKQISIDTSSGTQHVGSGYIKQLDVWNYGNLEIEPSYVLQPIAIILSENEFFIDLIKRNVLSSNFRYEMFDKKLSIKFDRILPKAGFSVRYYSPSNSIEPRIEGLIADPIRGATPIKNASLTDLASQSTKTEKWYWEVANVFILPVSFGGALLSMIDIRTATRRGKFIKNIIF